MIESPTSEANLLPHAYHEAGHTLASVRWLGHVPREVAIYGVSKGRRGHAAISVTSHPREALSDPQWRRIRVPEAVMFLAGLAAEEVAGFGRSSGIADLEELLRFERSKLNAALVADIGEVAAATDDVEGALAALIAAFPTKRDPLGRLLRVYQFDLAFLAASRRVLDALTSELMAHRSLSAGDIENAVADLGRRPPTT